MTAVVLFVCVLWGGIFVVFFVAQGSSAREFFFGRFAAPPSDVGTWKEVPTSEKDGGLVREERFLLPGDRPHAAVLVHQIRYRDPISREIVRVDPERHVPRRRIDARSN